MNSNPPGDYKIFTFAKIVKTYFFGVKYFERWKFFIGESILIIMCFNPHWYQQNVESLEFGMAQFLFGHW